MMRTMAMATGKNIPFGARLRAARMALGLTLDQLARSCNLSKGFLSRVERDDASPSVATLLDLCEVMNIEVGSLFMPPSVTLVRRSDAQAVNLGGDGVIDSIMTAHHERRFQIIHSLVEPGGHGGEKLYSTDCESEVAYVLQGDIEMIFVHHREVLHAGDALTFCGREPHSWKNISTDHQAEIIWVIAPAPSSTMPLKEITPRFPTA